MKKPLVSVIIPTLNEEKYLENCLKFIKNQDYKGKYEIIVADCKSKDKTLKIAKKYADKIVVTEKRRASAARNVGAKVARGGILLFVDADTLLLPDVISEVVKHLNKRGIVGVSVPIISDDIKKNFLYLTLMGLYYLLVKIKLQPIYGGCFACKKKSFLEVNGFNEDLKVAEDIELGGRLKKIGKISYITSTFVITSARRLNRWGIWRQLNSWPLGYIKYKLLKKTQEYAPIR